MAQTDRRESLDSWDVFPGMRPWGLQGTFYALAEYLRVLC